MNAIELISHEVADLPEALQAEVLDFIGYLKTRYPRVQAKTAKEIKLATLATMLAPYRKDFGTYIFDREDANAK